MFRNNKKQISQQQLVIREEVLITLEKNGCQVTREKRENVMRLSETKFGIFEECVTDLKKAGLLNQASYEKFSSRQLFHMKKVEPLPFKFGRRLVRTASGTEINLPSKAKKELSGSGQYADVSQAYSWNYAGVAAKSLWAYKGLRAVTRHGDEKVEMKVRVKKAKREVRCNRLIGRKANFFKTSGDVAMVLTWQPGEPLYALKDAMVRFTFAQRLKWCIDMLTDLADLHQAFIVHGDLHANNAVIDIKSSKAAIIDFGMSRKSGPGWQEMNTDLLQFEANILQKLFAEELLANQGLNYNIVSALCNAMSTPFAICSSLQALNYCNAVAQNLTELSLQKINVIAQQTLDRKHLTVDDVLMGTKRPDAMRNRR